MPTIPGLRNFGNVCYLNCILQSLASCNEFIEFVAQLDQSQDHLSPLLLELLESIATLLDNPRSASAREVWRWLQTHSNDQAFLPQQENDAAESLNALLSLLQEEAKYSFTTTTYQTLISLKSICSKDSPPIILDSKPAENNLRRKNKNSNNGNQVLTAFKKLKLPCQGQQATEMQCLTCKHKLPIHLDPFLVLSLPLETHQQHNNSSQLGIATVAQGLSVLQCLKSHRRWELIQDYTCAGCSLKASLKQQHNSPPPLLSDKLQALTDMVANGSQLPDINYPSFFSSSSTDSATNSNSNSNSKTTTTATWQSTTTTLSRRSIIITWPRLLLIDLRRNYWHPYTGQHAKICGHVGFPRHLNVCDTVGGSGGSTSLGPFGSCNNSGDGSSNDGDSHDKIRGGGGVGVYTLKAVVAHTGLSPDTGHYITYRSIDTPHSSTDTVNNSNARNDCSINTNEKQVLWFKVSDEAVTVVDVDDVLCVDASLLFYEMK